MEIMTNFSFPLKARATCPRAFSFALPEWNTGPAISRGGINKGLHTKYMCLFF